MQKNTAVSPRRSTRKDVVKVSRLRCSRQTSMSCVLVVAVFPSQQTVYTFVIPDAKPEEQTAKAKEIGGELGAAGQTVTAQRNTSTSFQHGPMVCRGCCRMMFGPTNAFSCIHYM